MWERKDNALDANCNADHIWFDGIGGQHTQKPADIRKWEDSKVYYSVVTVLTPLVELQNLI